MNVRSYRTCCPCIATECAAKSAQLVEEHLADCGDCTALLAELRKGPAAGVTGGGGGGRAGAERISGGPPQILSEKAQVWRRLSWAQHCCCWSWPRRTRPMEYREGLLTAALAEDSVLDLYYYGGGYVGGRALPEGGEENALFVL